MLDVATDLWPHQTYAIRETLAAIEAGQRRICLTSPTGGGKTRVACELIEAWLDDGLRVSLYTNRRLLIEQTSRVLSSAGLNHGMRAAGHAPDRRYALQLSSIQTEGSRVLKRQEWDLHQADSVLIDEAHIMRGDVARALMDAHSKAGAAIVGLTATPIGIGELYSHLIQAGTTSELRACGALVRCDHFGPDEPDLRHIGKVALGEDLSERQNVKAIMVPGVFGRVLKNWRELNPEGKPTILFAPGVGESLWFAERFHAAGITAAHIDGEEVWVNGKSYRSNPELRCDIMDGSRDGSVRVVCNRFVLREGIDAPWFAHGIFATVFGSLQSYLQSGGRLLRAHPHVGHVTLQDHGGNWWRHGSLNADRIWRLDYTAGMLAGLRADQFRNPAPGEVKPAEPVRCPRCTRILACAQCPCGWTASGHPKSRPVVQADGTLKHMSGDVFKPHRISTKPDAAKLWERMYHRSVKAGRTFAQAEALFALENNWGYPSPALPLMPIEPIDRYRKVSEVPRERLTQGSGK